MTVLVGNLNRNGQLDIPRHRLVVAEPGPLIISADNHYHGATGRQAAVCLPSKPEIQDNAYYQELSRVLMTVS